MNKGTKIAVAIVSVLLIGSFALLWSMVKSANQAIEKTRAEAVTAGNEILALFAHQWDPAAIQLRTAADFQLSDVSAQEWKETYGGLVSGEVELADFEVASDLLTARLEGDATFDKRAGRVAMVLTREPGNAWLLADFDVRPSP